jgi:hypothetical protein
MKTLRILTWQVHGNYLWNLSHVPHQWLLVTRRRADGDWLPGYVGRSASFPWPDNVCELPAEQVPDANFDRVLYQSRTHWDNDRHKLLSAAQRRKPCVYLEHDLPQQHPTDMRHWAAAESDLLVHVTPYNALMWDSGSAHSRVIEHAAKLPDQVRYEGDRDEGLVVVNHLLRRGRRLGADIYLRLRQRVPLALAGTDAEAAPGGVGEIANGELPAFMARYRFLFHPARWSSLGLAVVEALSLGMPVLGLATTELSSVISNGQNGWIATDPEALIEPMQVLLRDRVVARRWGECARATARQRFGFARFVDQWTRTLADPAS